MPNFTISRMNLVGATVRLPSEHDDELCSDPETSTNDGRPPRSSVLRRRHGMESHGYPQTPLQHHDDNTTDNRPLWRIWTRTIAIYPPPKGLSGPEWRYMYERARITLADEERRRRSRRRPSQTSDCGSLPFDEYDADVDADSDSESRSTDGNLPTFTVQPQPTYPTQPSGLGDGGAIRSPLDDIRRGIDRITFHTPTHLCDLSDGGVVESLADAITSDINDRITFHTPAHPSDLGDGGAIESSVDDITRDIDRITFHTPIAGQDGGVSEPSGSVASQFTGSLDSRQRSLSEPCMMRDWQPDGPPTNGIHARTFEGDDWVYIPSEWLIPDDDEETYGGLATRAVEDRSANNT